MNDITLISILSLSFGFAIILLKMVFKSKCAEFSCFGITVKRDIVNEMKEHEFDIKNGVKDDDLENLKNIIK